MQILICGGGNAAHTLAGLISAQEGLSVRVYLSFEEEASQWREGLEEQGGLWVRLPEGQAFGRPAAISSDPAEVTPGAELVLLALPAFAHEAVLRQLGPHLRRGAWVGALPARGGFDLGAAHALGEKANQVILFGLQTLPWACRIEHYGRAVRVLGAKMQVDLACHPPDWNARISQVLSSMLGLSIQPVSNFLSLTLAGTGQLIHPGIMYGLFNAWDGAPFEQAPFFYQGVDAITAGVLASMSEEVQSLRRILEQRFSQLDLSAVRPLEDWLLLSYSSDITDATSLQSSFVTNRSYAGLKAPMQAVEGGLAPDFQSRYLSEDVPYALVVTRGIAELLGAPTPIIDRVIDWAQQRLQQEYLVGSKLCGRDLNATRAPQRYGYTNLESLLAKSLMPA